MTKTCLSTVISLSAIMMLAASQLVRAQPMSQPCQRGYHSCATGCCEGPQPKVENPAPF